MNVLVTGGNGQLARSYGQSESVFNKNFFDRKQLDIVKKDEVNSAFEKCNPDIVYHFASLTRRLECSENKDLAFRINVIGTKNIVDACKKYGAKLIFVSTNEVFDGRKNNPYTEKDTPNPITTVGKTKYEAEKIVLNELEESFVVRTMWLYSRWSKNFLQTVLKIANDKKEVSLVNDEIGSPSFSMDVLSVIDKLAKTDEYGIYHVVNDGAVSREGFAKAAFRYAGLSDIKINSLSLSDFGDSEKPPLYSPLSVEKIKSMGILIPKWDIALKKFIDLIDL